MADPIDPSTQDPQTQSQGGGIGNFLKQYGGMLLGGLGLLGSITMLGGMPGILLGIALAVGGFIFGPKLFGQAQQAISPYLAGSKPPEKPKPQKYLPIEVELVPNEPTKSIATIDGQKYDIEVKFEGGKPQVKEIFYTAEGGTKQSVTLNTPVTVGGFDKEGNIVIDEALIKAKVAKAVADKVRKEGKEAVNITQSDARSVDKDTFLATSADGKIFFTVKKTEEGFELKNLKGDVLATRTLSKEALEPGGPIMREVGVAVAEVISNPANAGKLTGGIPFNDVKNAMPPIDDKIVLKPITSPTADKVEFDLGDATASYSIDAGDMSTPDKNGKVKINAITLERNGRSYRHALSKPVEIGEWSVGNKFTPTTGAMESILKEAVAKDDSAIKEYEKNITVVGTASAGQTPDLLYQAKDGTYIIKVNEKNDGFSITDINGNVIEKNGKVMEKTIEGGNALTIVREALHMLKEDVGVSSKPVEKTGLKTLAANETPAIDKQGLDYAVPEGGFTPNLKQVPSLAEIGKTV